MVQLDTVLCRQLLELEQLGRSEIPPVDADVVVAGRERDAGLEGESQVRQIAAVDVVEGEFCSDADHSAADIDTDGGRNDSAQRGNHCSYGASHPAVGVGHQGDVRMHERHRRCFTGLLESLVLEL